MKIIKLITPDRLSSRRVIFDAEGPDTRWRSCFCDRSALALSWVIAFRPVSRRYSNQQT